MQDLIQIHEGNNGAKTVDARELHGFLGSKQDFTTWVKSRIGKYGFIEGEDYLLHKKMEQHESGAKLRTEYTLTLDMAKELAMVEANERGQQARRYFIEAEKQLREVASRPEPQPQLKKHTAVEYVQASKDLPQIENPMLRSILEQRLMEEVGQKALPESTDENREVILTTLAKDLGYTEKQIGTGSELGRFVSKRIESEGKQYHGRYKVNVYKLTPELKEAVHAFLAFK